MSKNSSDTPANEAGSYAALGASSSKAGVHAAVGYTPGREYFAELFPDVCRNPNYYSLLHADGAGTKAIVAYIAFKESSDPSWFRSLAQDSLVMNLDDVACVGAFDSLALCNTIGRNKRCVPDDAIEQIVAGYRDTIANLAREGVDIELCGGETADVGDIVRTLIVDSSLFARVKRDVAVSFNRIADGDVILGISSTGQCGYENSPNSGIGSNGLTLARHALIASEYAQKYPEILAPEIDPLKAYQGKWKLFDTPKPLTQNIARSLLSPTRSYAPFIKRLLEEAGVEIHGIVHCTGGGQTKIGHFGKGNRYIKTDLFPVPPIFELIQQSLSVPWAEMYAVFNMGHRLEIICNEKTASTARAIADYFKLESRRVGVVEHFGSGRNEVVIDGKFGTFHY